MNATARDPASPASHDSLEAGDERQSRRDAILDAAAENFVRRGIHGSRIAEIARDAGMRPGNLYNFFDSKEAMIAALIEREVADHVACTIRDYCQGRSGAQAIVSNLVDHVLRETRPSAVLELEIRAESTRNAKVADTVDRIESHMRERMLGMLREGMASEGTQCSDDELEIRMHLLGVLLSGMRISSLRPAPRNGDALRARFESLVRSLFH